MPFGFTLAEGIIHIRDEGIAAVDRRLGTLHGSLRRIVGLSTRLGTLGLGIAGVGGTAGLGAVILKSAMDAETGFAQVRKTTGLTGRDFEALKDEVNALGRELGGISNTDLRGIAALGGQLGIQGDELAKFTEDIAKAQVGLDIPAQDAAEAMSELNTQFRFGLDNVNKVTSAVNELSNTTRASAADILEVTRRLSGPGATLGLTLPEVAALSTSMRQAGVSAEVAGTFMGKLMLAVADPEQWEKYGKAVGMTRDEFGALATTKPFEAIKQVVRAISEARGAAGAGILKDLDIDDQRGRGAILQLARAFDTLETNVNTANDAFAKGTSIEEEYAVFSQTTSAQLQRLGNNFTQAAGAIGEGLLPAIKELADWLSQVADSVRDNKELWADFGKSVVGSVREAIDVMETFASVALQDPRAMAQRIRANVGKIEELEQQRAGAGPEQRKGINEEILRLAKQSEGLLDRLRENAAVLGFDDKAFEKADAKVTRKRLQAQRELQMEATKEENIERFKKAGMEFGKAAVDFLKQNAGFLALAGIGTIPDRPEAKGPGLIDQLKEMQKSPFFEARFGGGRRDEEEGGRGGEVLRGGAAIWQRAVREVFERQQRETARKAEQQREQQIKTMDEFRKDNVDLLEQINEKLEDQGAKFQ